MRDGRLPLGLGLVLILEGQELTEHDQVRVARFFGELIERPRPKACAEYVRQHVNGPPCLPGPVPHWIAATTPKPRPLLKRMLTGDIAGIVHTHATMYDNPFLEQSVKDALEDTYALPRHHVANRVYGVLIGPKVALGAHEHVSHDAGTRLGWLKANVAVGLESDDADEFRAYIRGLDLRD